jgi:hypothetical protein
MQTRRSSLVALENLIYRRIAKGTAPRSLTLRAVELSAAATLESLNQ